MVEHDQFSAKSQLTITDDILLGPSWRTVFSAYESFMDALSQIGVHLDHCAEVLSTYNRNAVGELHYLLQVVRDKLSDMDTRVSSIFEPESEFVVWLELGKHVSWQGLSITVAPVHCGQLIRDKVIEQHKAAICVSATLQTKGSFSFFMDRVGLDEQSVFL